MAAKKPEAEILVDGVCPACQATVRTPIPPALLALLGGRVAPTTIKELEELAARRSDIAEDLADRIQRALLELRAIWLSVGAAPQLQERIERLSKDLAGEERHGEEAASEV